MWLNISHFQKITFFDSYASPVITYFSPPIYRIISLKKIFFLFCIFYSNSSPLFFHGRQSSWFFVISTILVKITSGFCVAKANDQFLFLILLDFPAEFDPVHLSLLFDILMDFQAARTPLTLASPTSVVTPSQSPLLGLPHLHHL